MGHKGHKYLAKQRRQLVNRQENKAYYQNGSDQKSPRTEARRMQDRKPADR